MMIDDIDKVIRGGADSLDHARIWHSLAAHKTSNCLACNAYSGAEAFAVFANLF